jgi:hypothetical protein
MDKPISVGDLVQIIRERICCQHETAWGHVFVVSKITKELCLCSYCGKDIGLQVIAWTEDINEGAELMRLKRIPPLSELEGERIEGNIREPA